MPESTELEPRKPENVKRDVEAELRLMNEKIRRLQEEKRGRLPGIETK